MGLRDVDCLGRWCFVLAVVTTAWAQQPLTVLVKDPAGSGMAVSGRLQSLSGGIDEHFQTEGDGKHTFPQLAGGRYRLEAAKSGFAPLSVIIDVGSGKPTLRTLTMQLAAQAERIDVVAATPLPGTDLALDQIAAPVQTASARDLQESAALDLTALMNRRLSGVHINENQGNPFQSDVNYRGYTASPLLGTPEGISVYMDGVRQNQPFGDIVAWDLIPKIAISEMALMPGSNPLYGQNTLGGAISIQTKDGNSAPGLVLQVSGGSFGRRAGELEYGGSRPSGLNWYVAGNLFREDGWRQFSPSEVRQAFGKLGWTHGNTVLGASFSYADNWLTGNGLQDTRFLAQSYSSVYSIPDITWNRSPSVNLTARHAVSSNLTLSANAYFRYIRADTTNGDINEDSFDQLLTDPADPEPFPSALCIAEGLRAGEPSKACTGLITNTFNKQNNWGATGQLSWLMRHNHFTAGGAWDRSSITFQQASQFGYLNADRLTFTPIEAFADGSTSADGEPVDTRVNLHGRINTFGFYATDTLTIGKSLAVTLSGRYNRTSIENIDRLPVDTTGARGSLNGSYIFDRLNPAAGLTYTPVRVASLYFSYSESSRPPTAIELGCADPNEPCNLPNALVSDPPLKQVVTRTLEAGVRSAGEGALRWSAGWFRGQNYNDLLFVASEQTGFGYFTNFGKTRRQGAEVNVSGRIHHFLLGGNYTFLDATYQSLQSVDGGSNSVNDGGPGLDGNITVQPGDRIPQTPRNIFKSYVDYHPFSKLTVDLDFLAVGRSFARGNENNLDQPDEVFYLGSGYSPGYGVLNLGAHYQAAKRVQLFMQINNVLNHRYYTAAQLGPTPYDDAGNFVAQPFGLVNDNYPIRTSTFYAPGAPVGAWGGLRITF